MARRKQAQPAKPPEIPVVEVALEVDPVPEIVAELPAIVDDGAALGYPYPEGAEGRVTTLRDFGSHRICQDATGRKLRQYKG